VLGRFLSNFTCQSFVRRTRYPSRQDFTFCSSLEVDLISRGEKCISPSAFFPSVAKSEVNSFPSHPAPKRNLHRCLFESTGTPVIISHQHPAWSFCSPSRGFVAFSLLAGSLPSARNPSPSRECHPSPFRLVSHRKPPALPCIMITSLGRGPKAVDHRPAGLGGFFWLHGIVCFADYTVLCYTASSGRPVRYVSSIIHPVRLNESPPSRVTRDSPAPTCLASRCTAAQRSVRLGCDCR